MKLEPALRELKLEVVLSESLPSRGRGLPDDMSVGEFPVLCSRRQVQLERKIAETKAAAHAL